MDGTQLLTLWHIYCLCVFIDVFSGIVFDSLKQFGLILTNKYDSVVNKKRTSGQSKLNIV